LAAGEGAAPSRHAKLAFSRAYKTPLDGWCHPTLCEVVLSDRKSYSKKISSRFEINRSLDTR